MIRSCFRWYLRHPAPLVLIVSSLVTIVSLSLGAAMPQWMVIGWVALAGLGWALFIFVCWLLRQIMDEDR